ncbi:MAG: hypothetical protein K0R85_249 [Devosia sp.]|jgi:hypothetical protein|nr:hypothetical protein [Devosia sp.]
MAMHVRDAGAWRNAKPHIRDAGVWKAVKEGYVKQNGVWVPFYNAVSPAVFVGGATGTSTTLALPAHQAGDLLVMIGVRSGSLSPVSVPTGWATKTSFTFDHSTTSTKRNFLLASRTATAAGTASGTWTNAARLIALVFRNSAGIGNVATRKTDNTIAESQITIPAVALTQVPALVCAGFFVTSSPKDEAGMIRVAGDTMQVTSQPVPQFSQRTWSTGGNVTDASMAFELLGAS